MKEKVAVATVDGKAYFLLVNELKDKNIDFLSIVPGEPVPAEAKLVITTEKERPLVKHEKILIFADRNEPIGVINEALKILQGKERYEKIVIGIDPGEVFGLAVVADGKVVETRNCFNTLDVIKETCNIVETTDASTLTAVKIGNGVPIYRELLASLDTELPTRVILEVVSEAGTDRLSKEDSHRRGLRDIASAIRIASRTGRIFQRGTASEQLARDLGFEENADFVR